MKKTMIYLKKEQHEALRRLAFETDTTMSDHVRKAIDKYLFEQKSPPDNYKNVSAFYAWLKKVVKADVFEMQEYLKDLEVQYGNTGMSVYEISHVYTKTGKPETYSYEVEIVSNDDDTFTVIYVL